jgi:type IV pilus assembly protein PilB
MHQKRCYEIVMKLKNIPNGSFLDTINQLQLAIKSIGVYPEDHPITTDIISHSYDALAGHLNDQNVLTFSVYGNKLLADDLPLESKNNLAAGFAVELEQRAIDSISFYRGLSRRDHLIFIKAIARKPFSRGKNGDIASFLKSNGVSAIRVNEITYGKVTGNAADRPAQPAALREKKIHDVSGTEPAADEGGEVAEYVDALLSGGKSKKIEAFIEGIAFKTDDGTGDIRKRIAERLEDVTSALNEIDTLKDNFQKISNTLINWIKKESDAGTYLSLARSLHNICASLNKLERYLIDETIGGRLFEESKLTRIELQEALKARKKSGGSLQYHLGALNLVDEAVLTHVLAQQYKNCPVVNLSSIRHIHDRILKTIPEKYIRRYQILPFKGESGNLHTATMNPDDWQVFNDIRFISGRQVVPHLAAEYHLINAIERFYNIRTIKAAGHPAAGNMQQEEWNSDLELVEEKQETFVHPEELKDSDAPIIKLANVILDEAIKQKVSDIHIEPYENELRVRLRIDGTLITVLNPSKSYANGLASRIKIMSGLDISERRLPQDGRFKVRKGGKCVDFRVSIFPGIFGEKIVMRLLDDSNLALDMDKLGFSTDDLTITLSAIYKSKGMILVTGPTGSGKTTTLYSMLRVLNNGALNISTAEDPIEYNLTGINQFQMSAKIGLDFARALRTFLRQDPDIIMVGEIRDYETAEIAFKAALTGHLVLSTLHTNSAPETITRLLDIGIEPYIIASSLNLIIAQRLLRKNCEKCRVEAVPTDLQLGIFRSHGFVVDSRCFIRGEGCEECNGTGYKGRIAIYEVMPLSPDLQEWVIKGKSSSEIKAQAEKRGFTSLQEQGFQKLTAGIIAPGEWIRVLA